MENTDNDFLLQTVDDDHLMMNHVICEEADLFYLDCYLKDLFHNWCLGYRGGELDHMINVLVGLSFVFFYGLYL